MRTSKFSEEQIVHALRQAEGGTAVADICRKMEITETTFYRWKKKYFGLGVSELRELKLLREEIASSKASWRISRSTSRSCGKASQKNSRAGGQARVGAVGRTSVRRVRATRVPRHHRGPLDDGLQGASAHPGTAARTTPRARRHARELRVSAPARTAQARGLEGLV